MSSLRFAVLLLLLVQSAFARPTNAPLSVVEIKQSMDRGIQWLLKNQNKDGSWGSATKTKELNIFAPVPGAHHGFKAGVTAMSIEALIETGAAERSDEARQVLDRGEEWLLNNVEHVRRADTVAIYNVWAHAYAIQALVAMHERTSDPERKKKIKEVIATQVDRLKRYESVDGGWGYYDFSVGSQKPAAVTTSFTTATVLYALNRMTKIGMEAPSNLVQRGTAMVNRQRKPDFTYLYSFDHKYRPMWEINRKGGSLGRSQACNISLRVWGDKTITDDVLAECLDRLVERYEWLSIGRKRPVPHESWFLIAGYFFYYGHYYAALCADLLPPDRAANYRRDLARIIVPLQEKDGSWWDYPLYNYHQPWGTSFALMTLQRCLPPKGS
ncbi:MAG TPA: hypothetical protein VJ063_03025 [Verrucomicrobiae bacterium]|nr:hypothetical protein [Verrucomicrobiae bacterium]